jgi:phage protein U
MMMSLGLFLFSLPTLAYQELQRRTDYRHAQQARVGARDASQFLGPGDETIALNGTAMAELQDGQASLDALREMGASGEAWSLVDGTGRAYGAYVIIELDERHHEFHADGTARQIDFGIDLRRVDDAAAADTSTAFGFGAGGLF